MTSAPGGRSLVGDWIRLDPSVPADADELFVALDHAQVWEYGYGGGPAGRPGSPEDWITRIHGAGADQRAMFTVRELQEGRIVGTSSLGDVDLVNERVHLGWTAYDPSTWSTAVNPECKLLLLTHAFEDCGFGRVKIQTDSINQRSQAAIAKLGAQREGVLRRHIKRADGSWRDTVVFAVTIEDWPQVKQGLQDRLAALAAR